MRSISRIASVDTITKGYLIGHGVTVFAIAMLALVDALDPMTAGPRGTFWAGIAVFAMAYAGQLAAIAWGVDAPRAMKHAFPLELVTIALIVVGTHARYDIGYLIALAVPLFYVVITRERVTWVAGGLCAATYMLSHAFLAATGAGYEAAVLMGVLVKGGAILYLSVALAYGVSKQAEREDGIREANERSEMLNDQLQRRLTELHAVSEITEIIHSSLDFDSVGPVVIDVLQKVMGLPSCSLFVIDKAKAETLFSATRPDPDAPAATVPSPMFDLGRGETAVDGHHSCISVFDHNTTMVVFCAESEALAVMTAEDRLVLQAVASELVVAVENSQLYKLTRRLAVTDELTSLHNYRYLQQRLDEEVERARRYRKQVSLIMLDVDDFKGFNDANGHMAGDVALSDLGSVLRGCVREVDVVARYGGEEFSVILPETDATGAYVVAEKIREAVAVFGFADAEGVRDAHLTVSLGVATYPEYAYDKETLLKQADDALYRAKDSGKDRVRSPQTRLEAPEEAPAGKEEGA